MNFSTSIKRLLPLMMLSLMLGSCEKEKAYALDTCVVSGKPLGSMGKPVSFSWNAVWQCTAERTIDQRCHVMTKNMSAPCRPR